MPRNLSWLLKKEMKTGYTDGTKQENHSKKKTMNLGIVQVRRKKECINGFKSHRFSLGRNQITMSSGGGITGNSLPSFKILLKRHLSNFRLLPLSMRKRRPVKAACILIFLFSFSSTYQLHSVYFPKLVRKPTTCVWTGRNSTTVYTWNERMIVHESLSGCIELSLYVDLFINTSYTWQIHLVLNWSPGKTGRIKYHFW